MNDPNRDWFHKSESRRRSQQQGAVSILIGAFVLLLLRARIAHQTLGSALILAFGVIVGVSVVLALVVWILIRPKSINGSSQYLAAAPPWVLQQAGWNVNLSDNVTLSGRLDIRPDSVIWTPSRVRGSVTPHIEWSKADINSFSVEKIPNLTPLGYVVITLANGENVELRVFQPKTIERLAVERGFPTESTT